MTFFLIFVGLLLALLLAGIWAVMSLDLLKSAIALALVSVILTLLLFLLQAPLAGVFELSVCAGLITVVFISAISLTKPLSDTETRTRALSRVRRFILLPIIIAILAWVIYGMGLPTVLTIAATSSDPQDVQHVFWGSRRMDLVGQILIILAGVFGVVILFKNRPAVQEDTKS